MIILVKEPFKKSNKKPRYCNLHEDISHLIWKGINPNNIYQENQISFDFYMQSTRILLQVSLTIKIYLSVPHCRYIILGHFRIEESWSTIFNSEKNCFHCILNLAE